MREVTLLNHDWLYCNKAVKLNEKSAAKLNAVTVNLPHCPKSVAIDYTNTDYYKMSYFKNIKINDFSSERKYYLHFGGVMNDITIYINNKKCGFHVGGYSEFLIDITKYIKEGDNSVLFNVNSRFDTSMPIGKSPKELDFIYPTGIYREVELIVTNKLHISEVLKEKATPKDGIMLYEKSCRDQLSTICCSATISNETNLNAGATVNCDVLNATGTLVASAASEITIKKNSTATTELSLEITNPELWTPSYPYLYQFVITVLDNGVELDRQVIKRGIRYFGVNNDGLTINDLPIIIKGVSRHEQYPYVGHAISTEGAYRDAFKIKKSGFNTVKTAYYPASKAFIDACDELGLIVIEVAPAYRHMQSGAFCDYLKDAIIAMARRDRNSTSIALWQATPSQVGGGEYLVATDKKFIGLNNALLSEFPLDYAPLICGDTIGRHNASKIDYDVPFCSGKINSRERFLPNEIRGKGLVAEYGDFDFGENESLSRIAYGSEGEMLLQAWSMQWQHNNNLDNGCVLGDILSNAFDHNSAIDLAKPIAESGIMDSFRLPKFSAEFYRSQDIRHGAKNVFIATFWDDERISTIPVYSNCEVVRLSINGKVIDEKTCDCGAIAKFQPYKPAALFKLERKLKKSMRRKNTNLPNRYWALPNGMELKAAIKSPIVHHVVSVMYNGGNCNNLKYPPFTFGNIKFESGTLLAEGLVNGNVVAQYTISTPQKVTNLGVIVDYSNRALANDGSDSIFVTAKLIDENGATVRNDDRNIIFNINNGNILGNDVIVTHHGVASTLINANYGAENVTITLSCQGLHSLIVGINLNKVITLPINPTVDVPNDDAPCEM